MLILAHALWVLHVVFSVLGKFVDNNTAAVIKLPIQRKWFSSPYLSFHSHISLLTLIISVYSSVFTSPPSLTRSPFLLPVFCRFARPLFHGSGSAGHWCAMSFSERSQEFSTGGEPPPLPLTVLRFHFHNSSLSLSVSLCLFPGLATPSPPPFISHGCRRLTASPKSESWNRWNMNGSLVYEKGVWVKEVV